MHFAALIGVADSFDRPSLYDVVNLGGTRNILAAMQEWGVSKIVYSSSAAVYGETESQPINELTPASPTSPYSETKWLAEELIAERGQSAGVEAVVLRYFNAAGASGEAEIGEDHRPESHLIPLVLDAAMGRRKEIQVYGDDYPTPDGSAIRDYIHVCDLADAHVAALIYLLEGGSRLTCNLGTGTGNSVLEVIRTAQWVVGHPISHRIAPRRQGDPHSLVAAIGLASVRLGWYPQRSRLETIIRDAWRWHEARFS
jgi:UDP-glucose 4-epimerase